MRVEIPTAGQPSHQIERGVADRSGDEGQQGVAPGVGQQPRPTAKPGGVGHPMDAGPDPDRAGRAQETPWRSGGNLVDDEHGVDLTEGVEQHAGCGQDQAEAQCRGDFPGISGSLRREQQQIEAMLKLASKNSRFFPLAL